MNSKQLEIAYKNIEEHWTLLDYNILFHNEPRNNNLEIYWSIHKRIENPSDCQCQVAKWITELLKGQGMSSLPVEKIEDTDEFKALFNDEVTLIKEMTPDQIVERIREHEKFIREKRTRVSADRETLAHRKSLMSKKEREDLEAKDRLYKVKPIVEEKEKVRKAPQTKEEKAVSSLADLVFSHIENEEERKIHAVKMYEGKPCQGCSICKKN